MFVDIVMPIALLAATLTSLFLNQKTEKRLKDTLQEREFRVKDTVALLVTMAAMIALVVLIPSFALMILFLFSYSMLLFIFTYVFSNNRWYFAVIPPIVFILLYVFLGTSLVFEPTFIWSIYLVNIYGLLFAVLITLYIGNLFTWKTTAIFAVALTGLDIVLVLITGTMVSAANKALSLNLPVLVTLPTFPPVFLNDYHIFMRLGLGDFFFTGLLALQTLKRYGRNFAIMASVAMATSFFIWEAILLNYRIPAFPGTVMIIIGWLPFIIYKSLKQMRVSQKSLSASPAGENIPKPGIA
jgi:hypothetical protein